MPRSQPRSWGPLLLLAGNGAALPVGVVPTPLLLLLLLGPLATQLGAPLWPASAWRAAALLLLAVVGVGVGGGAERRSAHSLVASLDGLVALATFMMAVGYTGPA